MSLIKKITSRKYPYIIAEIGINHNGDMKLAQEMIISAKENGADCVKFQSFIADDLAIKLSPKASYQKIGTKLQERKAAQYKIVLLGIVMTK